MKKFFTISVLVVIFQVTLMADLNLPVQRPEIYKTKEYIILMRMSNDKDKERYRNTLNIIRKPALQIVKYYPGYSVKGIKKNYKLYQKEVWLYMISKQFKGRVLVFIDEEIDGLVNEGTDEEIDGVGIMTKKGFKRLHTRGEEQENNKIIFMLNRRAHNMKTSVYKKLFKLAIDNSDKTWIPFNHKQRTAGNREINDDDVYQFLNDKNNTNTDDKIVPKNNTKTNQNDGDKDNIQVPSSINDI